MFSNGILNDKGIIFSIYLESKSSKAGLTFPVGRIQSKLRKGNYAKRVGTGGSVYLAGVLEYLTAEILELSGHATKEHKRVRITPRHMMLAIKHDPELNTLLDGATFSEAGVLPNLHPALIQKKQHQKDSYVSSAASAAETSSENFE